MKLTSIKKNKRKNIKMIVNAFKYRNREPLDFLRCRLFQHGFDRDTYNIAIKKCLQLKIISEIEFNELQLHNVD